MRTNFFMALIVVVLGYASVGTAAPLPAILESPESFLNQHVEITAPVAVNAEPQGGEYKKWTLILGDSAGTGLMVSESGFNPATIVRAYQLVEKAREMNGEVTVAGRLEQNRSGVFLKLESVRYQDAVVNTDEGPFVDTVYADDCTPGSQKVYDGHTYFPGQFPY